MPEKETLRREGKAPSMHAGKSVREEIHHIERTPRRT